MGCGQSKPASSSEVENPCKAIISTLFDSILVSRNNLILLESAYCFVNLIMQSAANSGKDFPKSISDPLKSFYLQLPLLLQEKNIKEEEFLKYLLPVESAYLGHFHESPFDLRLKIKTLKEMSTVKQKDEDTLNEFFLIEAGSFWLKSFKGETCKWSSFIDKFTAVFMSIFDKDLEHLPADKKGNVKDIKENIKLLIRYEVESNNDMQVTREGWNSFSFRVLFNFEGRSKLVERASVLSPTVADNKLQLTLCHSDGVNLEVVDQKEFVISEKKIELKKEEETKEKDLTVQGNKVKVGREKAKNDIIIELGTVSREHFSIWMKKNMDGQNIKNEFYLSNQSKSFVSFIVEPEGYLLATGLVVHLSDNKEFTIKAMHPEFSPKAGFLSVEPQFFGHQRTKPAKLQEPPFIELEFLDNNYRERKVGKNEDEDFTFNIGSGPNDTIKIKDKTEKGEEMILPDHCQIRYDGINKCWIIKDQNIVQPGNKIVYKTKILCYNDKQYEDIADFKGTTRGIKFMKKMKIEFGGAVFAVNEI